ncbi:MAG: hypothetical protein M5U34_10605 [Chloroflexi bacterium]|nr:hypothetical protein [Chloroflexota bacterium]
MRGKIFELLMAVAEQISPVLRQVSNMASLQRINDYVFAQNQTLIRERRYLNETVRLYTQYVNLITPELKRPFAPIEDHLAALQSQTAATPELQTALADLNKEIAALKTPLDTLINLSGRVQIRQSAKLQLVNIDEVIQSALRSLKNMAEARRVTLNFTPKQTLPPFMATWNNCKKRPSTSSITPSNSTK